MIFRLLLAIMAFGFISCDDTPSRELNCRSDMKYFCKEWIENCDNSRCDEEDYRVNCRLRTVFICE